MDGFPVFLSRWIPYEYDRLLDGSGFEYLQVCAIGTPLIHLIRYCNTLELISLSDQLYGDL